MCVFFLFLVFNGHMAAVIFSLIFTVPVSIIICTVDHGAYSWLRKHFTHQSWSVNPIHFISICPDCPEALHIIEPLVYYVDMTLVRMIWNG